MSRPRIDHNKGTLHRIQLNTLGRPDTHETIVHRPFELAPLAGVTHQVPDPVVRARLWQRWPSHAC